MHLPEEYGTFCRMHQYDHVGGLYSVDDSFVSFWTLIYLRILNRIDTLLRRTETNERVKHKRCDGLAGLLYTDVTFMDPNAG